MNTKQLADLLPHLVGHVEDMDDFRTLLPPRPEDPSGGVYGCRSGPAIVTFMINDDAALRITAGIARDVRLDADLRQHINELNAKVLTVGRVFYKEGVDGSAAVLMQEIVDCAHFDDGPSLNAILIVIARTGGLSARLAPEVCDRHGGRPWSDEEALSVSMLG